MSFQPHYFGKYVIVDLIASGGMADVYRAKLANTTSGDRLLVIKKIKEAYAADPDHVELFEQEMEITASFTHPNIIQIYDHGRVDGNLFMAMEYVEGKNLHDYCSRLKIAELHLDIATSVHIAIQCCSALSYAHKFHDALTNQDICIVHRDVSPKNIMISYQGTVKLLDFGVAKITTSRSLTRAGAVKGTPAYVSPEQADALPVDGRSDIFSLGVVLWELLTGKPLFVADSEFELLELVRNAKVDPPSQHNPKVPPQLDAILLKALNRVRDLRYQDADSFQKDLHEFLYSFEARFNPTQIAQHVKNLFTSDIDADRIQLQVALGLAASVSEPTVNTRTVAGTGSTDPGSFAPLPDSEKTIIPEKEKPKEPLVEMDEGPRKPTTKPGFGTKPGFKTLSGAPSYRVAQSSRLMYAMKKQAMLSEPAPEEGMHFHWKIVIALLVLGICGLGATKIKGVKEWRPFAHSRFNNESGDKRPASSVPKINEEAQAKANAADSDTYGFLEFEHEAGAKFDVYINGERVKEGPDGRYTAPVGTLLLVEVLRLGYEDIQLRPELSSSVPLRLQLSFVPERTKGFLSLRVKPGTFVGLYLEGNLIYETVGSIERQSFATGKYKAVVENKTTNWSNEAEFEISESKPVKIDLRK